MERRNAAGKAFFKPVTAWNGSKEDKQRLQDELERLQKDPSILTHDAMLPELNNEFASVRFLLEFQCLRNHYLLMAAVNILSADVYNPMDLCLLRLPL